jgi:hypothetical protein
MNMTQVLWVITCSAFDVPSSQLVLGLVTALVRLTPRFAVKGQIAARQYRFVVLNAVLRASEVGAWLIYGLPKTDHDLHRTRQRDDVRAQGIERH